MNEDVESRDLSADVREMQILCGALMFGPLPMAGIVLFLVNFSHRGPDGGVPLFGLIMAGVSLLFLGPTQLIAMIQANRRPKQGTNSDDLIAVYRSSSLLSWAGLEVATLANLAGYMIGAQWWSFIIPGLALTWMAATFPTESKLRRWLRSRLEQLEIEES